MLPVLLVIPVLPVPPVPPTSSIEHMHSLITESTSFLWGRLLRSPKNICLEEACLCHMLEQDDYPVFAIRAGLWS